MASRSALATLLVVLGCAAAASATTFTVGDGQGWTTGVDYTTWASDKTFAAGDKLVFNFPSNAHTVTEVSKNDYDSCSASNALSSETTGPTTVTLTAGTHYYICAVSTHCSTGGMKLAVTAGSGSGSPATPAAPGTPNMPAPTTPGSSAASTSMQAVPALAVVAAVLVKLALF